MEKRIAGVLLSLTVVATAAAGAAEEPALGGAPLEGYRIEHETYLAGYRSSYRQSVWVAYRLTPEDLAEGKPPAKAMDLFADPIIVAKGLRSANPGDFLLADHRPVHYLPPEFVAGRGEECEREVYSLANAGLMRTRMHARVWERLRNCLAGWTRRFGELWVTAGPVIGPGARTAGTVVPVPESFYLIVARRNDNEILVLAFLVPQDAESSELTKYLTTVDKIEALTGLNFFRRLDPAVEKNLEATVAGLWDLGGGTPAPPKAEGQKPPEGSPGGPAPAGGGGDVWVDLDRSVFYYPGSKLYGKGRGVQMNETDARILGHKPSRR